MGPIGPAAPDDGQLIIGYDALRLAVHGIREAVPAGRSVPALTDVGLQWPQVKGSLRVAGASGWICLDVHGNPYDKAVPIVELTPQGGSRFVRIAWPEGEAAGEGVPAAVLGELPGEGLGGRLAGQVVRGPSDLDQAFESVPASSAPSPPRPGTRA